MEITNNSEIKEVSEVVKNEGMAVNKPVEKPDKLVVLRAKQEKAAAAVVKATKKAKAIEDEIAAEERKRRDKDMKQLDALCKKMQIELPDVIRLIGILSENAITISEAAGLISGK